MTNMEDYLKYYWIKNMIIILLVGIIIQGTNAAQQFEKQPDYSEVNPGHETSLTCKIFSKKGQCSWQKDNKPVGIYLGKYEWAGSPDAGDCSIRVMNSALEYDDGEWECQVTASDFTAQDALTSRPVKLVVRVPPNAPQLEFNGTLIPMGKNLTTRSGQRSSIRCSSRYGNPPPRIKWFIGDMEVVGVNQTNKTEEDNPKKWVALSILDYTFHKGHNGKSLRCVTLHEAFPTKSRDTQIILNIQYAPQVKLGGIPEGDLEENKNDTSLRCFADANPPANIIWRKAGPGSQIFSFEETVELRPLLRKHQGSYSCEAKNYLGSSLTPTIELDVKFPPKILNVGPDRNVNATLYGRAVLQCQAEGNPPPSYQWVQNMTTGEEAVYSRGDEPMLVIQNVTYEYQGQYICIASNVISGSARNTRSYSINLIVLGGPQVLTHRIEQEIIIEKGSEGILIINFCSNPPPFKTMWNWGSIQLEAGNEFQRFSADKIKPGIIDHCYEAILRVTNVDSSDSRHYYLSIANNLGNSKYSVSLQVRDPVSMATVVGTIAACLVLLVAVILIILYAFKTEKLCFSQRREFKPTDLESEKSDIDGNGSIRDIGHQNGKMDFGTLPPPQTEMSSIGRLQTRKARAPEPNLPPPEFPIMKQQQQNDGNEFNRRVYPVHSKQGINYSDLQLPKTSNNGSMRRNNKGHPRNLEQHPSQIPRRIDYTEIQFKPKANEQAEL